MKTRRIPNPLYGGRVVLVLGSDEELTEWLVREHTELEWDGYDGLFFSVLDKRQLTYYVLVSTRTQGSHRAATLAHELMHLTFAVMRSAEVLYSEDSEEAFTYYFGAIFESAAKHLG